MPWNNVMSWPIDSSWRCEFCDAKTYRLQWHLAHGTCFCEVCGAMYSMLDNTAKEYKRLLRPRSVLKPEYVKGAKQHWKETKISMSEWDDEVWASLKEEEVPCG